jgi:hypothetical protein
MTKKELKASSMDELQTELGMAMMPLFVKYEEQLKEVYGISDFTNADDMEKVGREIGMKLASDCPIFLKFITQFQGIKPGNTPKKNSSTITGNFIKLVSGDISYFQIKDKTGKIEKIWWMEYFEGADALTNNIKLLLNKKVMVTYTEREIYNASIKDYMKVKVATGMEVK